MNRAKAEKTNSSSEKGAYVRCAQRTVEVLLQGKWQVHILCAMRHGPVRIGQLGRIIPGASKKMLTQSLRRLEASGIVTRKDFSELILHVEYELHPDLRDEVRTLLDCLSSWGARFHEIESIKAARK
ncbi:winged helix-turn-helix transcriptional regulator [Granulicella cerasi]|uniref:Winged helix-turn-helix transcriptional regulator n=1 Tax=Granulicella cerasi TaxID=741063 RepID=A0ABW1Z9D9_9BACT|nr:winged helix-turn-helix transcriptional regulator [Granulicella cerasi]